MKTLCSVCGVTWPFSQDSNCEKNVLQLARLSRVQAEFPGLHKQIHCIASASVPLVPTSKLLRLALRSDSGKELLFVPTSLPHVEVSSTALSPFKLCEESGRFIWWSHEDSLLFTLVWCRKCQLRGEHSVIGIDITAVSNKRIDFADLCILLCPAVAVGGGRCLASLSPSSLENRHIIRPPFFSPSTDQQLLTPRRNSSLTTPSKPSPFLLMCPSSAAASPLFNPCRLHYPHQQSQGQEEKRQQRQPLRNGQPATPLRLYEFT